MKPLVAYGSTMHQSENIAKQIASHFDVEAVELNKVTMDQLGQTKFAIFVIATFGNGSFPKNSQQFASTLEYTDIDLSNLQFAELALGSNHYQFFCRAGEELNKMLTERGAKEVIPYVRSDKCEKDYGQSVIDNFKRDVTSLKADSNGNPIPVSPSEGQNAIPLIAYGSTMGAACKIAKRIAEEFGTEAVELNEVDLNLLEKTNFGIFVVSTFGDGELPDNAIEFSERLSSSSVNLSSLQFALLGLGSTKYKKFCAAGNEIYELLTKHGAVAAIPYVKSDKKSSDQGSSVIEQFVKDVSTVKVSAASTSVNYGDDVLIAYGSTMHSSEKIAKRIGESFGIDAVELNSVSISQLEKAKLAIVVIATIAEGRFPRNSQEFVDRLSASRCDLRGLKFALLGLGSTYYKDYCKAAVNLNKLLTSHGAEPAFPFLKSNKAADDRGLSAIDDFENRVQQLKASFGGGGGASVRPLVAYGSTRHKAEKIAKSIAESFGVEAKELNSVTESELVASKICVIVISTINEGDFPQNAREFCQRLCGNSNADLRGVQFALLGLGSSYYEKFCRASEELNKALISHGAKQLVPYVKSDKATEDNGDGVIKKFTETVAVAVKSMQSSSAVKISLREIGSVEKGQNQNEFCVTDGFKLVKIKQKVLLSDEGYNPKLWNFTLTLPPEMTYKAGDYVLVRPQNDPKIVADVLAALNLEPGTVIEIDSAGAYPKILSVLQLFSQFIDLSAKPSQALCNLVGSPLVSNSVTVYDLLLLNSSIVPSLSDLLPVVTQIEPRTYSISSERKGELDITVGSVIIDDSHPGLCTHYLSLPSTKNLVIEITSGMFKYPDDPSVPIIICGLGTGIAPIFSLVEHRQNLLKKKEKLGNCLVFVGTRYERAARKALDRLKEFEKNKVISKCYVAISREGKKQHIQDKLKEVDNELWEVWKHDKAVIYFCGPPNSAVDDMREIFVSLATKKENMTRTDAVSHCSKRKWVIEEF